MGDDADAAVDRQTRSHTASTSDSGCQVGTLDTSQEKKGLQAGSCKGQPLALRGLFWGTMELNKDCPRAMSRGPR